MSNANHESWRPEMLAGFADGELTGAERATVEARLQAHAHERSLLAAQEGLSRRNAAFWQKVAVPMPGSAAWQSVRAGIADALNPSVPAPGYRIADTSEYPRAPSRRSRRHAFVALATTAALIMAAVFLWPASSPNTGSNLASEQDDTVLNVARAEDVDIISIQGDDFGIVVIGGLPLNGPIELATFGEVALEAIAMDPDGRPTKPNIVLTDPKKPILVDPNNKTVPVP